MRKKFNKKPFLAAAALVLTAALGVGSAMAYFTSYTTAEGAKELSLGFTHTEVNDVVENGVKRISISNKGDYDCFTRVKIFSEVELAGYDPSEGWRDGQDGYWYYDPVLVPGETTTELRVKLTYPEVPAGDKEEDKVEDKVEEFNIVVIHECAPALYNEDGTPAPDWDQVIKTDGTE